MSFDNTENINEENLYQAALARFVDGEPEPGDCELLAQRLKGSPEAVEELTGALVVDELIRQHVEPQSGLFVEALKERLKAEGEGSAFVERVKYNLMPRSSWKRSLPWVIAGAACFVAIISLFQGQHLPQKSSVKIHSIEPSTVQDGSIALLVNHADAKFASGGGPDAVSFKKGEYELLDGAAHLRFRNGADVILNGPTKFSVIDDLHMRLQEGNLRALIPVTAHGFLVEAPNVRFLDRGTEFGVIVTPGGKQSELHVFNGEVEVYKGGSNTPEATYSEGQSVSVDNGVVRPLVAGPESKFLSVEAVSLLRWEKWRKSFQKNPNLVFYFSFEPTADQPQSLQNCADTGLPINGLISGAQWVAGRWPGKKALQFENAGDEVSLDIPGEFDQITFAAWIKIDRLENAANAILNSVGWRVGNIQWQVDRRASPAVTAAYSTPKRTVEWLGSRLPIGRWIHWVVTIDKGEGKIQHYVNGSLACISRITPKTTILKPGKCLIGRWNSDNKSPENRDFKGRIDEMSMWRIVLPESEIKSLYEDGMPIELTTGKSESENSSGISP